MSLAVAKAVILEFYNSSWNKVDDEYFIKVVNPTKPQIFYPFQLYMQISPLTGSLL